LTSTSGEVDEVDPPL
jgi:hypothetical protein